MTLINHSLLITYSSSYECVYWLQKSRAPSPDHVTSVEVQLATVHLYADVTLLDRLQPLIGALSHSTHSTTLKTSSLEKMKQSLYMTTSNFHTINLVCPLYL